MKVVLDHISHYILKVCIVPDSEVLEILLSCQKRAMSDISEKILKILKYILSIHCSEIYQKSWACCLIQKNAATSTMVWKWCRMSSRMNYCVLWALTSLKLSWVFRHWSGTCLHGTKVLLRLLESLSVYISPSFHSSVGMNTQIRPEMVYWQESECDSHRHFIKRNNLPSTQWRVSASGRNVPTPKTHRELSTGGRGALTHRTQRTLNNVSWGKIKVRTQRRLISSGRGALMHQTQKTTGNGGVSEVKTESRKGWEMLGYVW